MKAIVVTVLLLLEVVTLITAIPVEASSQLDHVSKDLSSQVRQKRGWGYEPVWYPSHGSVISTSVLGPSKTIIASPSVAVAPATYVVPHHKVATAVAVPSGHHSESFVYSTGPDYTHYTYQKHHPQTYYYQYHYPSTYLTQPTTHYVATSPVITTWP